MSRKIIILLLSVSSESEFVSICRVEMQEAGGTDTDWRSVASSVTTPDVKVDTISPNKDYNFRIRAEMENGEVGEATPPIQYHRTKCKQLQYILISLSLHSK